MNVPIDRTAARFFGLDLSALAGYLREGWAEALEWPLFRWLRCEEAVRVLLPDGSVTAWPGAGAATAAPARQPKFIAVVLPEEVLLRRSLRLPRLADAEVREAAQLEAHASSPFPVQDLVWGHAVDRNDGGIDVRLALTSRSAIEHALQTRRAGLAGSAPEVWAAGGRTPIVFPGFGESLRFARERRARVIALSLACLAACLLVALAATPALQLRLQAEEAQRRLTEIVQASRAQTQARDRLVKLEGEVQALTAAARSRRDVVALLDEITRLLPDDVVLTRFEVNGNAVRLVGQADNAAQLLQSLSTHAKFQNVRAPSGIARAPSGGKESFTIEFTVGAGLQK